MHNSGIIIRSNPTQCGLAIGRFICIFLEPSYVLIHLNMVTKRRVSLSDNERFRFIILEIIKRPKYSREHALTN